MADQLFATLDPTVRLLRLADGGEALLVDTVGFIHKLPHGFVDAFKSTLEEVQKAHLLLHVVDASDAHAAEHIRVVEGVLAELGAAATPRITVFNKQDLPGPQRCAAGRCRVRRAPISARTGAGIAALLRQISTLLAAQQERLHVLIPVDRGDLLAALHQSRPHRRADACRTGPSRSPRTCRRRSPGGSARRSPRGRWSSAVGG